MELWNQMKSYPLMMCLFLVTFISLTLIFIVGVYKFALIILISLILGFVGYLLDRSGLLQKDNRN